MAHYRYWIQRHVLSHSPWSATSCIPVQSSMACDPGSSSAYFILQAAPFIWNCCWEALDDYTYYSNKSAQDKKKFPKEKDNCLPPKKISEALFFATFYNITFCKKVLWFLPMLPVIQQWHNSLLFWFTHWIKENYVKREKKRSCVNMLVQRNILPSLLPFYLPD